jgi:lipopolysaccharide transport system permease protein
MLQTSRTFFRQSRALTLANLKCRYRKTWAGFLWVVLSPTITFSAQAIVFGQFLRLQMDHYLLFLVSGLIPWLFVAQTLEMSASVFVNSGPLMKSFRTSPMIYLTAQVFDNLINFVCSFALALIPIWIFSGGFHLYSFLLPLPLVTLAVGVYHIAWLLAVAQVFFRDTRFLVSFALQVFFFLTPIFYPPQNIPPSMQWLIILNPIYYLISPFQILIYNFDATTFSLALIKAVGACAVLASAARVIWERSRNRVYFYV